MKSNLGRLLFLSVSSLALVFSAGTSATESTTKQDNDAVSWLIVLDKNEIAAAKETLKKSKNPEVLNYAHLMIKDHTNNLKETEDFNPKLAAHPVKTDDVASLEKQGTETMKELESLSDKKYNTAYTDAMVNGHAAALEKLDAFIKEINDKKLKAHLEATRTHVNHHLEEAKAMQKKMS